MPRTYLADPKPVMTSRERNEHLSAKLATAPLANRQVLSIMRDCWSGGWLVDWLEDEDEEARRAPIPR